MGSTTSEVSAFALPAGTDTFLLTAIEGSTRLWEEAAEAMEVAVARHYELLDEAIARHGGVRPVEQGEGDSVVVAFTRAADGLATALGRHGAEGLTKREIGERMFISPATVKVHLSHIYAKLDLKNRSEPAAVASRRQVAERAET